VIAIDTNVLVRLLVADNPTQYRASKELFSTKQVFIPDTVILETAWVLRAAYDYAPTQICDALRRVFGLKNVVLNNDQHIAQTIAWHEAGLDFADALHLASSQDCESLKTFDSNFIKRGASLTTCLVGKP
jgi:predicted nucleic-acid-binding protein